MSPIARFEHVTKLYRRSQERSNLRRLIPGRLGEPTAADVFPALDDVSLEVAEGGAFGIVGKNGSGKSTVLKVMAGTVEPTEGLVTVRGRIAPIIELGVGFDHDLTGRENVMFSGYLLGMSRAEVLGRFDDIIEFSGVGEFIDMPVKRYSTGMKARLGFSIATAAIPDLLIIDEVLSVGDFAFQRKSLERVRELHGEGATLVVVSHNLWMMNQLCARVMWLDRGRVVADGEPSDVIGRYLGPDWVAEPDPTVVSGRFEHFEEPEDEDPPVTVEAVEAIPRQIEPGGPVVIRASIRVDRPAEGLVAMSLYTGEKAVFAERVEGPSDFLRTPGRWVIEARIPRVPLSTGKFNFRVAVLPEDDQEIHQQFLRAYSVGTTEIELVGPLTGRPGVYLDCGWHTELVGAADLDPPSPAHERVPGRQR